MAEELHHHDGDDCAGHTRPLTDTDKQQILATTDHMLILVAQKQWRDVVDHGRVIARHHGPNGEWVCASILGQYLNANQPNPLAVAVRTAQDPDLRCLIQALTPPNRGSQLGAHAETRVRHLVTGFADLIHNRKLTDARNLWNRIYLDRSSDTDRRGFIAFLLLWTSRTLAPDNGPLDPIHQQIRANAALN